MVLFLFFFVNLDLWLFNILCICYIKFKFIHDGFHRLALRVHFVTSNSVSF